ncbi:MAG TPA: AI-2E family transporter [Vicinamibacterales bacterium]|nr:AI-2E family transporter [Vicinamibacterales bacterium]
MSSTAVKFLVGAASLVIIAAGLRATAVILMPLVLAVFLSVITFPLVRRLQRRGIHSVVAVIMTLLAVLAVLSGPSVLIVTAIRQFASAVPRYEAGLRALIARSLEWLRDRNVDTTTLTAYVDPSQVLNVLVTTLSGVATLLSLAFLVVLISAFMLFEAADIVHRRPLVLPAEVRQHVARIASQVQTWLWVKTIISFATGVVAGAWVAMLGVEFALLWGLLTFLLNYIPNLGSIIAAFPPALLALIQFGPLTAVLVLVGYVVVNIAFGSFLEPYLMGRRVGLSPLAVLLSVIVFGWMWGIPGMLLSVPITMTIKIALENSSGDLQWVARLIEGGNREREPSPDRELQ